MGAFGIEAYSWKKLLQFNKMSLPSLAPDYENILKEASRGRASIETIFGDSLAAFFSEIGVRARRFFRNQHLDLYIPVGVLLISSISAGLLMHNASKNQLSLNNSNPSNGHGSKVERLKDTGYDFVRDLGVLVAATITIWFTMANMHREFHYKKREKASEFIKFWNSPEFAQTLSTVGKLKKELFWSKHPTKFNPELFNISHSTVAEFKRNADGVETLQHVQTEILKKIHEAPNSAVEDSVLYLLDYFEHMGLDVKNRVADSDYLKDFFFGIVIDSYELFRKYIEEAQISKSARSHYCNFVYLAQTWQKEGGEPGLPRVCIRLPIVTADDMQIVLDLRNKKIVEQHRFFTDA